MLLIKNGLLHLENGKTESGWDILTDGSEIKAIGKDLHEEGAEVIDAKGLHVYPGLVLAVSSVGAVGFADGFASWDLNETSNPITPQMDIRHAFDLRELKRQRFGRIGITSYGLAPGVTNLIAGQMSLIHVDGERTADVFLAERVALKGNFIKNVKQTYGGRKVAPQTRMAMAQMMDEAFRGAQEYKAKDKKDHDAKNQVLCRVLDKEIPFFVNAYTQSEIESIIQLGEKYDINLVISGAFGIKNCADTIIERGWHVVLGDPTYFMAGLDNDTVLEDFVSLYRKGLKLSISCSGDEGYPPGYEQLLWTAALMHRAGATGDEIMDMMTINPAKALGVDHMVGSLKEGKKADIMIARGNPAERFDNFVEHTIVAGKHFFQREGK